MLEIHHLSPFLPNMLLGCYGSSPCSQSQFNLGCQNLAQVVIAVMATVGAVVPAVVVEAAIAVLLVGVVTA